MKPPIPTSRTVEIQGGNIRAQQWRVTIAPDPLAGVIAKLNRAGEQIAQIDDLTLQYMMTNRPKWVVVPNRVGGYYDVTGQIESVPAQVAVVLGEFLHNMRSALDHLARQLVLRSGAVPVDKGRRGSTSFPIKKVRNGLIDVSPGLPAEIRTALEEIQPYNYSGDPDDHPLQLLSELNNIDKHRLLNVTSLSGAGNVAFVSAPAEGSSVTQEQRRHRVEMLPGETQRFTVAPDEMFDDPAMSGLWSSTVVLGDPGTGWNNQVTGVTRRIGTYVTDEVLPRLTPFVA